MPRSQEDGNDDQMVEVVADGGSEEGQQEEEEEGDEPSQLEGTDDTDSSEGDEEWAPSQGTGSPSGSGSEDEAAPTRRVRFAGTATAKPHASGHLSSLTAQGKRKATHEKTPAAAPIAGLEAHLRPSPALALTSGPVKKRPSSSTKAATKATGSRPTEVEIPPGPDADAGKPATKKVKTRPSEVALMLPKGPEALSKASAACVLLQMPPTFQTEGDMGVIGRWVTRRTGLKCCTLMPV
jgi:hypothetical protein